jgi:hypothetical protein
MGYDMRDWFGEKLRRLVFLADALFEAVQILGVAAIILGTRYAIVWLANVGGASGWTRAFLEWFVVVSEVLVALVCYGMNIPFMVRDIRVAWRRAALQVVPTRATGAGMASTPRPAGDSRAVLDASSDIIRTPTPAEPESGQ